MLKSLKYAAVVVAAAAMFAAPSIAHAQYVVPEVRVNIAPPPPRVEVRTVQPSANHMWIAGHWAWRYGRHEWISGHWAEPPNAGMVWEPAHWRAVGGQWSFIEGHWRWASAPVANVYYQPPAPPAQTVYIQSQPPPVINEVRSALPYAGAVWIPGYWHWNGYNHVWVGGHWSAARAGWRWEADHWVQGPSGWYRVPGRWVQ